MDNQKDEVLSLRAHHICCLPFWRQKFEERGPAFVQLCDNIKSTLLTHPDSPVMVSPGPDALCHQCLYYRNERCTSPRGNEDEVRKWDAILLRELALPFGACLTTREWQVLLSKKAPFKLCRRCPWKQTCSMGAEL